MNWKEWKNKWPQAYHAAIPYITEEDPLGWPMHGDPTLLRNLYDFFDGQGIYIFPDYREDAEYGFWYFYCHVYIGDKQVWETDDVLGDNARTEAETAAFTKAFELLEQKLNKK